MIFMPVTRPWAADRVIAALDASDCPKEIFLYIDAGGCMRWVIELRRRGWAVDYTFSADASFNLPIPSGMVERRVKHNRMRLASQRIVSEVLGLNELILFLEDDTIVPPQTWTNLSRLISGGAKSASGVQRDRHGSGLLGLWSYDANIECFDPVDVEPDSGIRIVDAVGHYCFMTHGDTYVSAEIPPPITSIDRVHTRGCGPVAVDTGVWCGHLTESGEVIV